MSRQIALTSLPDSPLFRVDDVPFERIASGKVREIFDLGENLLIVATDRLSAFDVVLPSGVAGKGIVLTQLSLWWFEQTADLIPNHLVPNHDEEIAKLLADFPELQKRSMLVRKLKPLPVEAVVRRYLSGSGWSDYKKTGKLFGQDVPAGLVESDKLPEPLFTPTTKAHEGHDEPITPAQCAELLGEELFATVRDASFRIFARGQKRAAKAGLILADTKFEFGQDEDGKVYLIDEVLTPDSSRYWPADEYQAGRGQHAFDKQYVRDYLNQIDWDKTPPGPILPDPVIKETLNRYIEAWQKITGQTS